MSEDFSATIRNAALSVKVIWNNSRAKIMTKTTLSKGSRMFNIPAGFMKDNSAKYEMEFQ